MKNMSKDADLIKCSDIRRIIKASVFLRILAVVASCCFTFASEPTLNARENDEAGLTRYEFNAEKMGVPVRILAYASNETQVNSAVEKVWKRFDELNAILSDYDPESEVIRACRDFGGTGNYAAVSVDLRRALEESRKYCVLTDGAFDPTVSPIVKLWRRSRIFHERPPQGVLASAKTKIGLNVWDLSESGLKTENGVRLDFGGIAKGIALDESLEIMRKFGITSVLIDASGDLRIGDPPPGQDGWIVGVASLLDKPAFYCALSNVGIASSGDANRYVVIDGVRYSHIIDPRTCEPLTQRCVSAVMAPDATSADALASALCVLGKGAPPIFERIRKEGVEPLEYILLTVKPEVEELRSNDEVDVLATPVFSRLFEESNNADAK